MTSPSIPAVLRPALSSVTRRTLTSVLARDRSINFCKLRTFFRSPALLAVKIRCLKRCTSRSTARHETASQSTGPPVGPFTSAEIASVSNLPSGSSVLIRFASQAHLVHVSSLAGRASHPVSGQLCGKSLEVSDWLSRFPAAFRRPAFASWTILSRWGSPLSLRSAYQDQHRAVLDPSQGFRVPRA